MLCLGFKDPVNIFTPSRTSVITPVLNGLVALVVQGFFAWKIHVLGKGWARFIVPCAVVGFGLTQLALFGTLRPVAVVFVATNLLCDLVISSAMISILVECKGGTSRRAMQKILNGLIINVVENGAVISACLALNLVLYTKHPGNMIHVSCQLVIGRLYGNVLLASINGRIRRQMENRTIAFSASSDMFPRRASLTTGRTPGNTTTLSDRSASVQLTMLSSMMAPIDEEQEISFRDSPTEKQREIVVSVETEVHTESESSRRKFPQLGAP